MCIPVCLPLCPGHNDIGGEETILFPIIVAIYTKVKDINDAEYNRHPMKP